MLSKSLGAVVLTLVLVTAGCLGTVQGQSGATTTTSATDSPTISTAATAQVEAEPDLAVVHVAIESSADSASAAREQVATDADAVRQALRDAGIPDDAITTTRFQVQARYDHSDRTPTLVGYHAVHALEIEVADVDRAGEIVDVAVENGATRVDGVQFTLAEETRASLHEQALTQAMADARADADTIAAAGDLSVTGVHTASTSGGVSGPVPGPVFAERDASSGGTQFSPGPVTVSAHVSVTYTAEAN